MTELYPLLLKPEFRERIWGTRDLSPLYGEAPGDAPIGEVWLTADDCRVANGALAGMSLGELCRRYGRELVGETASEAERFPLLVKFLFPREKLSVQVHPDNEAARSAGLPCGKTECWYVLKAEPEAQVALGLKPGTTREDFARAIEEVRAEQLLNWMDIHAGEMIYVDAGTVHAISSGSILVETQQNSDTTYRLYDYGRPRELHVKEGLAALKERTSAGKIERRGERDSAILIQSPCFIVEKHHLHNRHRTNDSWQFSGSNAAPHSWRTADILVALEGCGVVYGNDGEPVTFGRADAVVIPASMDDYYVRAQWDLEMLTMNLPPSGTDEQVTADSSRTKVRWE
jgi:mannose-6-phosphate isomerase